MAERIEIRPLPPREAIEYFRSKGYADPLRRFDYRDVWREEHARNFVVAKAMQDDVLSTIRSAFDTALAEGQTLETFREGLAPQLRAMGWWGEAIERDPLTGELKTVQLGSMRRLRVIFDTNMRTAYAAGRWTRLQATKDFLPYLEYRQLDRPTAREEHKPFDGLILPIDHPLWALIFPPNGWFCACDVRPLNDRMLEREGKRLTTVDELEALASQPWTNPRTGETEMLLQGLDPSFASNPGAAWLDIRDRHTATAIELPDSHAAYDRGYVQEVRARTLRNGAATRLLYDLDAPPEDAPALALGEAGSEPRLPDVDLLDMQDARMVLIASEPSSLPVEATQLDLMARAPGLAQIVSVGPDGSIWRVARQDGLTAAVDEIAALDRAVRQIAEPEAASFGLSGADLDLVIAHALLRVLQDQGRLQYAWAPSGAKSDILADAAGLIAAILVELVG